MAARNNVGQRLLEGQRHGLGLLGVAVAPVVSHVLLGVRELADNVFWGRALQRRGTTQSGAAEGELS